jgi:hypothetical protein
MTQRCAECEGMEKVIERLQAALAADFQEKSRLRAALKEIRAYSVGDPRPRHTWYYDRAEEALRVIEQPAVSRTSQVSEQR